MGPVAHWLLFRFFEEISILFPIMAALACTQIPFSPTSLSTLGVISPFNKGSLSQHEVHLVWVDLQLPMISDTEHLRLFLTNYILLRKNGLTVCPFSIGLFVLLF